jgi:hypothetical protein
MVMVVVVEQVDLRTCASFIKFVEQQLSNYSRCRWSWYQHLLLEEVLDGTVLQVFQQLHQQVVEEQVIQVGGPTGGSGGSGGGGSSSGTKWTKSRWNRKYSSSIVHLKEIQVEHGYIRTHS